MGVSKINAQKIILTISGYEGKTALFSIEGEKTVLIDSFKTDNGKIVIQAEKNNFHNGLYRLTINERTWIDFICDGNDVEIQTNNSNVAENLIVVKSESNKLFHQFIRLNKAYKTKSELLQLILARFPKDDEYYNSTKQRLQSLQNEYIEFVNITSQKEPVSFIAAYIHSAQLPIIDTSIPIQQQIDYLKSHALDYVNFKNSLLIYSDLFTNKAIEYLTYFRNPQLPKELLEKEFMKAVDSLFNKAKVNQLVYQHIAEYLIDGFKKFGFDKIIDYIVENYVIKDDLCLDAKTENSIQRRIDQSKKLSIGTAAPNIKTQDINGNIINLSEIKSDKTLLIFYASWCPHCQTILPEINSVYKNQNNKKMEVVAISLDEKKDDWLKFVKDNNLNWVNTSDGKGWDGKAASDYFIYATPTMFLLDKDKKIIAKPMTSGELKNIL